MRQPVGLSKLHEGLGTEMISEGDLCEEKKLYYRVVSGEWHRQGCMAELCGSLSPHSVH